MPAWYFRESREFREARYFRELLPALSHRTAKPHLVPHCYKGANRVVQGGYSKFLSIKIQLTWPNCNLFLFEMQVPYFSGSCLLVVSTYFVLALCKACINYSSWKDYIFKSIEQAQMKYT